MKALVGAFNQKKVLVGAFSVIVKTSCGTDGALHSTSNYSTPAAHLLAPGPDARLQTQLYRLRLLQLAAVCQQLLQHLRHVVDSSQRELLDREIFSVHTQQMMLSVSLLTWVSSPCRCNCASISSTLVPRFPELDSCSAPAAGSGEVTRLLNCLRRSWKRW